MILDWDTKQCFQCFGPIYIFLVSAWKVGGKSWKISHQSLSACCYWHSTIAYRNIYSTSWMMSMSHKSLSHHYLKCMAWIHLLWHVFLQVVPLQVLKEDHVFCMYITAYNDRSHLNALNIVDCGHCNILQLVQLSLASFPGPTQLSIACSMLYHTLYSLVCI